MPQFYLARQLAATNTAVFPRFTNFICLHSRMRKQTAKTNKDGNSLHK